MFLLIKWVKSILSVGWWYTWRHRFFFSMQVEELRSRLAGAEKPDSQDHSPATKRNSLLSNGVSGSPPALPKKPLHHIEVQKDKRESVPTNGVIVCSLILSNPLLNPLIGLTPPIYYWIICQGHRSLSRWVIAFLNVTNLIWKCSPRVFSQGSDGHPAAGPQGVCRAAAGALWYYHQTAGGAAEHWGAEGQGEQYLFPSSRNST